MRMPKYLSYTSFSLFETNREEFYLNYLADQPPPRLAQTQAMAVGAGFDAAVKSSLHRALFGSTPEFEFETIFEAQVEPPNRDFAHIAGAHCLAKYHQSGAYTTLLDLLQTSTTPPRFEFKVEGLIEGIPFLGKPDCKFTPDLGMGPIHCILDWKVRGYCSAYGASPTKGYMLCDNKTHKLFLAQQHRGLMINAGYLETCHKPYADQLCLYGWLLGEKPGDEEVVGCIEEIIARPGDDIPRLRVATHRARVKADYQLALVERIKTCWQTITSGQIFPEDNEAKCEVLENTARSLQTVTPVDTWMNEVTRPMRAR